MKIALAQPFILWKDKTANLRKGEEFILKAARDGAEAIFFPEMSFTGFTMNVPLVGEDEKVREADGGAEKESGTDENDYRKIVDEHGDAENSEDKNCEGAVGSTLAKMKSLAVKAGIAIGFGWVRGSVEPGENHYTIVNRDGTILSDYVKLHPFSISGEDKHYTPGSRLSIFELGGMVFSSFICYDLRFPEIFRVLPQHVHVIVVAACWPEIRRDHWLTLLRARAIENQVYICGVNSAGIMGKLSYSGDSCVVDPEGKVLCTASGEALLFCEIADDVENFNRAFPTRKDRRPGLYRALADRT